MRNKLIYLFGFKAGLRAKEIAPVTWLMVCDADGNVGKVINLNNLAGKGKYSGRVIPMHNDLRLCLLELFNNEKQRNNFSLGGHIIRTERSPKHQHKLLLVSLVYFIKTLVLTVAHHIADGELL